MRPVLALLVLVAVLGAACGSDGGGGSGDVEAFCAQLAEENGGEDLDLGDPAQLAEIQSFVDDAPSEIRDQVQVLVDKVKVLDELDEDDPDAFGLAFGLLFDPEFLLALESIEEWGVANCDLEPGSITGGVEGIDSADDLGTEGEGPSDDVTDDLDLDVGGEAVDIDALWAYFDDEHGDAGWVEAIDGTGTSPGYVSVSGDVSRGEAVEVCEAVTAYLEEEGLDEGEIEVQDASGETVVDNRRGSCAPV